MRLELIVVTPDHQTRRVPLDGERVTLGRAHSNDLCYPEDASLSRRHLQFERSPEGWFAEDLGSKNGTLRNGARLEARQPVAPGDRLAAGHLLISVVDADAAAQESVIFVPGEDAEVEPRREATILTSLEGVMSGEATAPLQFALRPGRVDDSRGQAFRTPVVRALVRAGRELAGQRPLSELFQLILDLSIEAVGAERGVLMTLEGEQLVLARGPRRPVSHQHQRARSGDPREGVAPGARPGHGRGVPPAAQHQRAADPDDDGGAAADRGPRDRPDLRRFALVHPRVHARRPEPADRAGERRRDPHRARAVRRDGAARAAADGRPDPGRGDPARDPARAVAQGRGRRPGRTQRALPHGRRRLLRLHPAMRTVGWPWSSPTSRARACPPRC